MSNLMDLLESQDIFGHPIGVNYKGDNTFKTRLGALCTIVSYALILFNTVTLTTAYKNHSKLETGTQQNSF